MAEVFKEAIKQNAFLRRETRRVNHVEQHIITATTGESVSYTNASTSRALGSVITSVVDSTSGAVPGLLTPRSSSVDFANHRSPINRSEGYQSPILKASSTSDIVTRLTTPSSGSALSVSLAVPIPVELGSVMIYLDHVFPFLFPFYQPPLIETGRQWLLGLLCQNEASFHIAASLSAYFFTLAPQAGGRDMHDDCKALVLDRLLEQMDMAIKSMQNTISAVGHRNLQCPILNRSRIMEEITQLLIVEVTIRDDVDWAIHLTPALALFDETFKSHGFDGSRISLAAVLREMLCSLPMAPPDHKPIPNTPDQSALVFFVSVLLFIDVIASTSLGAQPYLQNYHHHLLSSDGEEKCDVRLATVVGCQNWVIAAIGKISALCAWKRDAKQSGTFSVISLVNLAGPISQALEEGLTSLDINAAHVRPKGVSTGGLPGYYSRLDGAIDDASMADITRIWAYAAKIYLSVSLSGWQAKSVEIQASVAKVSYILQTIESPA